MNVKIFILFICGFRMMISGTRQCSSHCLNGRCDNITGVCDECPDDRYGNYCAQNCTLCKDEQCDKLHCIDGCKNGYYPVINGDFSDCSECSQGCLSCTNSSICAKCDDGYFVQVSGDVNSCEKCNWNCATCSTINDCFSCEPGYYGEYCGQSCSVIIPNCSLCNGSDAHDVECTQCSNGTVLKDNECRSLVSDSCPSKCLSCSADNVCESCMDRWHGSQCDKACSDNIDHCLACIETNDVVSCTTCSDEYKLSNGTCVSKITHPVMSTSKTVGPTTSQTKSVLPTIVSAQPILTTTKTVDSTQFQTTSSLIRTSSLSESSTLGKKDNSAIVIGALAGGGGLTLIVVILIIVCLIRGRRNKDRNVYNEQELVENGQPHREDLADYPVYAKPNKTKTIQQTEDYTYATPIKDKRSDKELKVSIKEAHQAPHSNVQVNLDMEEVIEEADLDRIRLETLEGEFTSEIEMGASIPASDTYYNVDGLLRSRIQVHGLLEYIKKKADFDAEFNKLPKGLQRSCNIALKVTNRKKNRFNGIYAYDATRVELKNNAYINANYIDGHNQAKAYIASLGPTSDTMNKFSTFWGMIWQENVEVIVMLTNLEEGGKMKCEQYWPNPGARKSCHDYIIKCANENIFAEFVVRDLSLEKKGIAEKRHIKHYHYTAWPDRYVPDTVASLVEFRDKVEDMKRKGESPIVVHCSAGIGRTGTYVALDLLIKEGRDCGYVDIFGCALGLRGQRVNLIQNGEQYEYLHHAVLYSLTCDTEPQSINALNNEMTDQRISEQFKAMKALVVPSKRLSVWTANYSERIENREGADVPSDSYRVRLQFSKDDYINAVYLNGYIRQNAYIAAQTPLPSTIEGFLSMVYHERCSCIVSLDEEEVAFQSVAQYLPSVNEMSRFGNYQIRCNGTNTCDDFIISRISIFKSPSERLDILHFQVRNWKSNEIVPSHPNSFLNLVNEVSTTVNTQNSSGPVLLHCLTGSQRCGLFCAVSIMLEKLAMDRYVSGAHIFSHIKRRRSTALQKQEMLKFCYHCVAESLHSASDNDHCYYNTSSVRH